ncbi:MAG TPA: transcription termination factor NusA [Pyrinomonadaceae bacterium]|nr:transcription termination factor NusA [Pyrinomonadaceae bacterium]HMP65128.1 transcription termination factor NusA [Pyrinomonadaceae bacterium]
MTSSIGQSIEILCNEQGLDRDMVIEAMKDAVKAAARKQFRAHDKTGESIQVDWNNEEGIIEISVQKTVVEEVENPSAELSLTEAVELAGDEVEVGDILLIPLPAEEMGRIAAQTAKQILVQKVREAIREKVYEEYIDRKGELINGTVKRFERGDIIIDLGDNLEAILPRKEQARGEIWNQGERIRVVILDVSKEQKGQQITVSRASAELIKRLFEMEVPEIYDDTVVIKSAVREPGDRAKIAVASNEKDVDPVGACVGMKGSRVQSIIKELRGEKIDIIEWSDEPSVFAANALSPAKVSQVRITDINNRQMEVIVGEDQLSLAIGKKGQNVRLATRLVGWNVKIVSEELLKQEIAQQMGEMMASGEAVPLTALQGVSATQAEALAEKGVSDVEALAAMSLDDLVETLDLSLDEGQLILDSANSIVAAKNARAETADDEGVSDELTEDVPAAGDDGITAEAGDEAAAADDSVSEQVDASAAESEDPAGEVEGDISSNQFEEEAPAVSDQELKQETADSESRSMESEEVDTSDIPEPSENENVGEQVPAGSEDADEEEKE